VLTDLTNYAGLYRGLQAAALPLVEDRSGLVYNPLSSVEVQTLNRAVSCSVTGREKVVGSLAQHYVCMISMYSAEDVLSSATLSYHAVVIHAIKS